MVWGINRIIRRIIGQIGMEEAVGYGREETCMRSHYRMGTLGTRKRFEGYFWYLENLNSTEEWAKGYSLLFLKH